MGLELVDDALLSDHDTIVVRGGGWMRQHGDDSASRGVQTPLARLYANSSHVGFQIHSRFNSWFHSLTIEEPGRDAQGYLSIMLAWRDVSTVRLASKSLIVSSRSSGAFLFKTHDKPHFKQLLDLLPSLGVPILSVPRTWKDFYGTTRRRAGRDSD